MSRQQAEFLADILGPWAFGSAARDSFCRKLSHLSLEEFHEIWSQALYFHLGRFLITNYLSKSATFRCL